MMGVFSLFFLICFVFGQDYKQFLKDTENRMRNFNVGTVESELKQKTGVKTYENNLNRVIDKNKEKEILDLLSKFSEQPVKEYTCYQVRKIDVDVKWKCSLTGRLFNDKQLCEANCIKQYDCVQAECVFAYECEQGGDFHTQNNSLDLCPVNRYDCYFQEPNSPCPEKVTVSIKGNSYTEQIFYDTYQAVCYHTPICDTNNDFLYNKTRDWCERPAEYYQETISSSKHCPSSRQTYNPTTDRCEAFAPAYCPNGYRDVGTYCEYRYPATYVPKTCWRYVRCNPHPCNCRKDNQGNEICDTCYDTCKEEYDCSYYTCPRGGYLDGTFCVKTASQICRDSGYVYNPQYDMCVDFDPPNCNKSYPGAFFYGPGDYCYWYKCEPPKGGNLYTFYDASIQKYKGVCWHSPYCKFGNIDGKLDTQEDRCELNPCPVGETPIGKKKIGSAGRCVYSYRDEVWNESLKTYVWVDKPSPRWQCSAIACSPRIGPENKAYCLDKQVNITVLASQLINTWFCVYEDLGGYQNIEKCLSSCSYFKCSKDNKWYRGPAYVCEQNCQEKGTCDLLR